MTTTIPRGIVQANTEAVFGAYQLSEQAVVEELLIRPQLGDI